MASLIVPRIAPFLDFVGLLMFVEKISMYLLVGATLYFSRNTSELADRDARFVTELTEYRAKLNAELTSRDEKITAEVQRILAMLNTSTARLDETERTLQTYHNNFGRVATEFESINGSISTLQNEINRYYAVVQVRSDISPEIRIEPTEEVELQDSDSSENQSEASSGSSQRLIRKSIRSFFWFQPAIIFRYDFRILEPI